VLGFPLQETIDAVLPQGGRACALGTLHRGEGGPRRFALSLAAAHAAGARVEWDAFFAGSGARKVPLPTYPFQHKRYWPRAAGNTGSAGAIGLADPAHPLLGAVIEDAQGEGATMTGRLSLETHPWLADHAIAGTALLPGTAFLELARKAAEQAGAATVAELALESPLALPERGAVQLQLAVSAPGEQGAREISIHSRPEEEGGEQAPWTCHARGLLGAAAPTPPPERLDAWPPAGSEAIELDYHYDRLAEVGFDYGPAFQGLGAAWRNGGEIYAQASLDEEQRGEAARFGIHPALLDAALHAVALQDEGEAGMRLPFAWSEFSLVRGSPSELRVRLSAQGESVSMLIADGEGNPLGSGSLALRPVDPAQLGAARREDDGPWALEWRELPVESEGGAAAEVFGLVAEPGGDPAQAARKTVTALLARVQGWLAEEEGGRLAILTRGAVAAAPAESPDPALAAAWGLLRSAQFEHPGRFLLIDSDTSEASERALKAALEAGAEAPQLALREGVALAPRAVAAGAPGDDAARGPAFDPDSTVLVTGGTGGLGALAARHLAEEHGARQLLLASRSGPRAPGATELRAELAGLGATATIVACDVSDAAALRALLDGIPAGHPLGAVIHCAGVLADATVAAMEPAQVEAVFAPKADAAWHLHELTGGLDLSAFVLFSSAAAVLGGPGQANYAAANAFLGALAQVRRAEGLPATSIAWGLWRRGSEMAAGLDEARMARAGVVALSDQRGLELFDRALCSGQADLLAMGLEREALRRQAAAGVLPPVLKGLVRTPGRRRAASSSLAPRLAAAGEPERERIALELVRGEVAAVLGHASAQQVDPGRPFQELGFDSLAAVELRNRLAAATGLRLAATAVFDYPSPGELAGHLLASLSPGGGEEAGLESGEREIREALASLPLARLRSAGLIDPLLRLVDSEAHSEPQPEEGGDPIDTMGVEELIARSGPK
jgi:NADP-dependent 3-hydroxy acid dehydrogenase YdfG/acyl carrier protein